MQNNKVVNILDRSVVKHNGVVLYTVLSGSDTTKKYFITVTNGVIDGETHQDCKGYEHRGSCYHASAIERIERDLIAVEAGLRNDEKLVVYRASLYGISEREAAETARCYRDIAWGTEF